jgi:hypothetical protein
MLSGSNTPRESSLAWAAGVSVSDRKSFKARDVPRSMSEPRWEMMRVHEAERRERVAQEAIKLAAKSKLPPRMQQHKETERARKAAEAERIQAELDQELTLKPRITEGVPDFDRLHANFERNQARKRQTYRPTVPKPFKMESEPFRQMADEDRKVKAEMVKRDMRRDELVMPERRWPYLSTQAPVGRSEVPDFKRVQEASTPLYETTELFKARLAKKLKDEEDRQKAMKQEVEAKKRREAEQKRATVAVASRLRQLAGDPRHLKRAQKEKEEESKRQIRKDNLEQRRRAKEWIDDINKRVSERPFLFEQASVDVAVARAKAEAHDKFDAALRKNGLADMLDP